jgi:hypothetical protein
MDQKTQKIIELIKEISFDDNAIEQIKIVVNNLQNDNVCEKKSKYLKKQLKEFVQYEELKVLIDGLIVKDLKDDPKGNIVQAGEFRGEDERFRYHICLANLIDIRYECSITYETAISSLYYKLCEEFEWREIAMYGEDMDPNETFLHVDNIYTDLKFKNVSKEIIKKFFLVLANKMKY